MIDATPGAEKAPGVLFPLHTKPRRSQTPGGVFCILLKHLFVMWRTTWTLLARSRIKVEGKDSLISLGDDTLLLKCRHKADLDASDFQLNL